MANHGANRTDLFSSFGDKEIVITSNNTEVASRLSVDTMGSGDDFVVANKASSTAVIPTRSRADLKGDLVRVGMGWGFGSTNNQRGLATGQTGHHEADGSLEFHSPAQRGIREGY